MKALGEVLKLSDTYLKSKGIARARRIAEELIAAVLDIKRLDLYMQFDRPVDDVELERMRAILRQAATGEPIEYILQKGQFYGCALFIDPRVLIPRPETEILIDTVCKQLKTQELNGKVALDLCCGSGCLGIALKKNVGDLHVVLADISEDALTVAAQNAQLNAVDVEFFKDDLLNFLGDRKIDILLCNPPYISAQEYAALDPSVRAFEPKLALVGGEDGLEYYRRLEADLPRYLNPGAQLFFEIGYAQGDAVQKIFSRPCWKSKKVERDWSGHDRFFFLEFE